MKVYFADAEWIIYEINGLYNYYLYEYFEKDKSKYGFREVPEDELNDISYLVDDKYIDYFTGFTFPYNESNENICLNRDIMKEFYVKTRNASCASEKCCIFSQDRPPVWAKMRVKYFGGRDFVYPDEMMEKLNEFDNREIIAFLNYCIVYKVRFNDCAYDAYTREGFIGKLLLRLKELPLVLQ